MEENAVPANVGASTSAVTPPSPILDLVEAWWGEHFPGSPVAQVTQAWNHAFAAKEELKRRLTQFSEGAA